MKIYTIILALLVLSSCQREQKNDHNIDGAIIRDLPKERESVPNMNPVKFPKQHSNERFRKVTAIGIGENNFLIEGEAQIFEANFGWIVEDGHNELASGFEMTDAGAPEWGKFSFTVEVAKARANSTLMLVLFESSAKDGTRQYELPVVLE